MRGRRGAEHVRDNNDGSSKLLRALSASSTLALILLLDHIFNSSFTTTTPLTMV